MKPRARTQGLVVTELPDELLVYDLGRHRAHCLNSTAALVFKHCDGRRSVAQIARILRRELNVDAPADESLVWLSLDRLERARLLEDREAAPAAPARRELVRRLALVAASLPVVASIVAPTPAEAAVSTCIPAASCTTLGDPPFACYNTVIGNCNDTCLCTGLAECNGGGGC